MKHWQIVISAAFNIVIAQGLLENQDWFSPKIENEHLQTILEPFLPIQETTYSMWYGILPDTKFSMQFSDIPEGVEYFIYPPTLTFELPKLEDVQMLPEQP